MINLPVCDHVHASYEDLVLYLKHKNEHPGHLAAKFLDLKEMLENCIVCWSEWNRVRWDAAENTSDLLELREYLGSSFLEYFDSSWANALEWYRLNPQTPAQISTFYRENRNYMYNLTIWHASGDRYDLQREFIAMREKYGVRSVIDYGCGIGTDTLCMLKQGLSVRPIDFDCPSTEYLNWRLRRRGIFLETIDTESIEEYPQADMFLAVDVLEHMANPLEVLDRLSDQTYVFAHISQFGKKSGQRHPFHLPFSENELAEHLTVKGFTEQENGWLSVWVRDKK